LKLIFTKAITKDVQKIKDKKLQKQISEAVTALKETESLFNIPNIKKIKGHPHAFRLRINDYRLGFYYTDDTILLARFLSRKDIYKYFP